MRQGVKISSLPGILFKIVFFSCRVLRAWLIEGEMGIVL